MSTTDIPQVTEMIFQGDSFPYEVELLDLDDDQSPPVETPINITGYIFWLTIKRELSDSDADAVAQAIKEDPHDDPTNGRTTLEISSEDTAAIDPGSYWFDVRMKDDAGAVTTAFKGTLTVEEAVTEDTSNP